MQDTGCRSGAPLIATVGHVTVDPSSEVAPYLQLAEIIRGKITSGEYPPGARLPSIVDLSATYNVARVTAHKSMRVLIDERLVVVSRGRGTYVRRK